QGGLVLSALVGSGRGSDLKPSGGVIALLFGLVVFVLAIQASFQAVARMEEDGIGGDMAGLRGLARRSPMAAALLALGLAGLAGLPPLAGFLVRILVASSAVAGGYAWVAVASVAASTIYAVAVLRWIGAAYVEDEELPVVAPRAPRLASVVGLACALFGVVAMLLAGPLLYAADGAASVLR
ncbi:MAG: proton-conducting transporter membrane subunit, partial [Candidatus Dormibacteria bacterium]